MRTSSMLLALPALSLAEEQVPLGDKLRGWFNKASSYIPSSVPSSMPDPVAAGAAKVASKVVHNLNLTNWQDVLKPSPTKTAESGPEEWMVYITGGNKTCYGQCGNATTAWNKSTPILAAAPSGPSLAVLDCEAEPILCNSWFAGPPAIYHFLLPAPLADQSRPATTLRTIRLNRTTVAAPDIIEIHTKQKYLETEPYEGYFHPFDGELAKYGLSIPFAYVTWVLGLMPSWLPMVLISFVSRSFMGRGRAAPGGRAAPAPAGQ